MRWVTHQAVATSEDGSRQRVLCEWDSQFPGQGMHFRSIYRDGLLLTAYERSTVGQPNGLEKAMGDWVLTPSGVEYDGTEGELYDVENDPHQWRNLWNDAAFRGRREDLVADLYASLPEARAEQLPVDAPA